MKRLKIILSLLIFINTMNFFYSCTPESIVDEEIVQEEQTNSSIQFTDDEDKEIDKSGKED